MLDAEKGQHSERKRIVDFRSWTLNGPRHRSRTCAKFNNLASGDEFDVVGLVRLVVLSWLEPDAYSPIYIGMLLGQVGLAIGFDNFRMLAMLVPFYLVIRYGVIAREEVYLDHKFAAAYLGYKSRVRRWL
jgi:hypothetical protein